MMLNDRPGSRRAAWLEQWPQGEAEIIGRDTRRPVADTTVTPYRYICHIEFLHPTSGTLAIGTGTLIGPHTVLTAAHNLFYSSGRLLPPGLLRVIPGRNGDTQPFGMSTARRLIPSPGFVHPRAPEETWANAEQDYAIIQLKLALGTKVGYWGQQPPPAFDPRGTSITDGTFPTSSSRLPVNLAGYPGDKPADPALRCRVPGTSANRCGVNTSSIRPPDRRCGTFPWRSFDEGITVEPRLLLYHNDSCKGYSGGPVWIKRSRWTGGRVLVGVAVGGIDPNVAARINRDVAAFIARYRS